MALNAGLDLELPATDCYGAPLLEALESGLVSEETLNEAVRRVLRTKFDVGVFEEPYVDVSRAAGTADMSAQRELARHHCPEELVPLKNDGLLPLLPEVGAIAVIGPNADTARNSSATTRTQLTSSRSGRCSSSGTPDLSTPGWSPWR